MRKPHCYKFNQNQSTLKPGQLALKFWNTARAGVAVSQNENRTLTPAGGPEGQLPMRRGQLLVVEHRTEGQVDVIYGHRRARRSLGPSQLSPCVSTSAWTSLEAPTSRPLFTGL